MEDIGNETTQKHTPRSEPNGTVCFFQDAFRILIYIYKVHVLFLFDSIFIEFGGFGMIVWTEVTLSRGSVE